MRQNLNPQYRSSFLKQVRKRVAVVALSSASGFALPSDRNQQLSLAAENATYNSKTGITTYTGNVVIEQGTMKLQADSLVVTLNSKNEIQTITAKGKPAVPAANRSESKGVGAVRRRILSTTQTQDYHVRTGNAYLYQDGSSIRGNRLKYSMNKGDVEAQGSSSNRVQIIIPPSSSKSFPGARD